METRLEVSERKCGLGVSFNCRHLFQFLLCLVSCEGWTSLRNHIYFANFWSDSRGTLMLYEMRRKVFGYNWLFHMMQTFLIQIVCNPVKRYLVFVETIVEFQEANGSPCFFFNVPHGVVFPKSKLIAVWLPLIFCLVNGGG